MNGVVSVLTYLKLTVHKKHNLSKLRSISRRHGNHRQWLPSSLRTLDYMFSTIIDIAIVNRGFDLFPPIELLLINKVV
jgi:hypothetical protein